MGNIGFLGSGKVDIVSYTLRLPVQNWSFLLQLGHGLVNLNFGQ